MKDVIVVTGASSGMGRRFVVQIAKKQKADEIWVIARRKDRLEELAAEITNIKIVPVEADLTNPESAEIYRNKLADEKPNVIILANCAGFGKFGHSETVPVGVQLNMIDLNCKAPVFMIDASLPYMKAGAKIMNICSCAAFQPIPYINDYAATKAYLLSYGRALNAELKYRGIHVLSVCPYWTKTEFFDRAVKKGEEPVVIKYDVMYDADKVMEKAIKDLYNDKKDVSVYGGLNNFQRFLTKILPHKFVMKVWLNKQKLDGTPKNR